MTGRLSRIVIIVGIFTVPGGIRHAHAQSADSCVKSGRPWVLLRIDRLDGTLALGTIEQLRRALAVRGVDVCTDEGGGGHIGSSATLDIGSSANGVLLTVAIDDDITKKRLQRDVDVRSLPMDAQPLAIAQAADELLRASWAEVFVRGSSIEAKDVPGVARAVDLRTPADIDSDAHSSTMGVGLGIGGELFSSGHAQGGPDVTASWTIRSWLTFAGRVGLRAAPAIATQYGTIDTSAIVGSLGAYLRPIKAVPIELGPSVAVNRAHFEGDSSSDAAATATSRSAVGVHVAAEARASMSIVPHVSFIAGLLFGASLRTMRAFGGTEVLHRIGGLVGGAQLGALASW